MSNATERWGRSSSTRGVLNDRFDRDAQRTVGDEIHSLLQLLTTTASGHPGWPSGDQWDWRPFAKACDLHQVTPFVFCRLLDLPASAAPPQLLGHLRARFYDISARNYRLAGKLVDLASLLHGHGVPVLAYKGPAVAMSIYDSLALRQFSDIDLIVQKKHLLKAVRALRDSSFETVPTPCRPQTVPYMCRPENPKHIALAEEMTLQAPDQTYFVDLHWQLGDRHWRAFSPDVERMWDRAESVNLPQGKVLTFCREDLFLALCYHGNKHRWSHLKWLLDIAQLLRGPVPLDWRRIEAMAKLRPGAGTSAGLALLLADQLLNAPVPSEAARVVPTTERTVAEAATIRNEIFGHGQTSGYDHPTLLALQERRAARMKYRTSRGAKYPGSLFREIFEQVSPGDRALIRLPEKFQFIYHVIRPVRLMVKYAVRSARALWRTNSLHGIR